MNTPAVPKLISQTPCTLLTGFLGSGKTTLLNSLLALKPAKERWALLINEFGQIGIDAGLIDAPNVNSSDVNSTVINNIGSNRHSTVNSTGINNIGPNRHSTNHKEAKIAIREVSGGCICCTSQLPLQIGLSRLLAEHHPQRLLIEPTGLAHPRTLLAQLSEPHWQTSLLLKSVICVLSGQQWSQGKYRHHEGYQAHVIHADFIAINRFEQLSVTEIEDLNLWLAKLNPAAELLWLPAP
ncbi:MAG: GTP-binding protein, partial [Psychrobacter sp.]|nr:GTP-binding protein [Psychrobacter sp.]